MTVAEPRDLDAFHGGAWNVGDVDVEDGGASHGEGERRSHESFDDDTREIRTSIEMPFGIAAQTIGVQRDRHRGFAEEPAFGGRRDRARIQHIVAEIRSVVDAGDDHVGFEWEEPGDREVHAVGGRPLDEVHVRFGLLHSQRQLERQ
jgi:hypothetical protein